MTSTFLSPRNRRLLVFGRRCCPSLRPFPPRHPGHRRTLKRWMPPRSPQWLAERQASPLAQWMFGWICRGGGAQVFEPYEASMLHLAWTMAVAPPSETPEDWLLYKGAGEVAKILANQLGSDVRLKCTGLAHTPRIRGSYGLLRRWPVGSGSGRCGGDSPCLTPQHSVRAGFTATVRPVDATDADALQMEGSGCVSNSVLAKAGFLWSRIRQPFCFGANG